MKHCLVTGGAGFIGSHLVEALLARGDRVSVVDDESTGTIDNLAAVLNHPRLRYTKGTVADEDLVRRLVADAEQVYHLAAAVGVALIAQSPSTPSKPTSTPPSSCCASWAGWWRRAATSSSS